MNAPLPDSHSPYTELARDIFLFSYFSAGINYKDIATLRYSDLVDGRIYYRRHKTGKEMNCRLNYNERAIVEAVKHKEHFDEVLMRAAADVYSLLNERDVETVKTINETMTEILKVYGIKPIGRVDRRYIELFFRVADMKRGGERCFVLMEKRK